MADLVLVDADAGNATVLITSAVIAPSCAHSWWQALPPPPHCLKHPHQDHLRELTALEETIA